MIDFSAERLQQIRNGLSGKRIAVIGDLMLDRYFWGKVSRISPEAPVPVVEVEEESTRLGGAANVANNIASLGGVPVMVGVVGNDANAEFLRSLVSRQQFPTEGVIVDASRPTTIKTRVIAHNQHVVRVDQETKKDISREVQEKILTFIEGQIPQLDALILEDYNKGVLTQNLITNIIALAKKHRKVVTVDPKYNNFFEYKGVSVFKPNRKESEEALGVRIQTMNDFESAAKNLLKRLNAEHVLLT
jgi:D-glycero-beta-D-manno-heptose-7-phosphate kinase